MAFISSALLICLLLQPVLHSWAQEEATYLVLDVNDPIYKKHLFKSSDYTFVYDTNTQIIKDTLLKKAKGAAFLQKPGVKVFYTFGALRVYDGMLTWSDDKRAEDLADLFSDDLFRHNKKVVVTMVFTDIGDLSNSPLFSAFKEEFERRAASKHRNIEIGEPRPLPKNSKSKFVRL